jgi:hypothetical protein
MSTVHKRYVPLPHSSVEEELKSIQEKPLMPAQKFPGVENRKQRRARVRRERSFMKAQLRKK